MKSILTALVLCLFIGVKSTSAQMAGGSIYKPIQIPQSKPISIPVPDPQPTARSIERDAYEFERRKLELDILREQRNALKKQNQKNNEISSITFHIGRINYLNSKKELTEWKKLGYKMTITIGSGLIEIIKNQEPSLYRITDYVKTADSGHKFITDKNTSFEIIEIDEGKALIEVESPEGTVVYFTLSQLNTSN